MKLVRYHESDDEEITAVEVPKPALSGSYQIGSLEHVEHLIQDVLVKIKQTGDPSDPAVLIHVYLMGYRDSLLGRKPNVP